MPVGAEKAFHIAVGADALWLSGGGTITRIDPVAKRVTAGIAAGDRFVWAATSLGVAKLDPTTNTVRSRIRLEPARFHYDIQLVDGSLWVSSTAGRIYRIDPNA